MLPPHPPQLIEETRSNPMPQRTPLWHGERVFRLRNSGQILLRESTHPLTVVNYALGALLWSIGLVPEAIATIVVVSLNLCITAIQLGRAQATLARIQQTYQAPIAVWRDAHVQERVPAALVVGDILMLRPGDRIPSQVSVLESAGMLIDTAAQTGESEPMSVSRGMQIEPGCTVRAGAAWVQTTAPIPVQATRPVTEVRRQGFQSAQLIRILHGAACGAGIIALITIGWGSLQGATWAQYITTLTVVFGLIPNALVVYAAVAHARTALPLIAHGIVVNTPSVVERMADVDVVCFDKTGTLTTNALTLEQCVPLAVAQSEFLDILGAYAAADGAGNQSSVAIARAIPRTPMAVRTSTAFDSRQKWSSISTATQTYVLGAPDVLAPSLAREWQHVRTIDAKYPDGRVLLLLAVPPNWASERAGAIPIGAVILREELRPGVHAALAHLQSRNVRVVVLSGDDPRAVSRVATAVGITGGRRIHATALEADPLTLTDVLRDVSVIGRMKPAHKADVIRAFQQQGQRVAFVGDGYNDLDALRTADVAVAFAAAHSVVRDSADIVILGDDMHALTVIQHSSDQVARTLQAIGELVLTRVTLSAVVWLGTMALGLPTWSPIDSTVIALLGVALPSLVIVAIPHRMTSLGSLQRVIVRAAMSGICLVGGWWLWVVAYGWGDIRWLTGAVICFLWGHLLVALIRRTVVVR